MFCSHFESFLWTVTVLALILFYLLDNYVKAYALRNALSFIMYLVPELRNKHAIINTKAKKPLR